jgi:hypothetical protein
MAYRLLTVALTAASVALSGSALAQKKADPTTDSLNLNSSRSNIYRQGSATSGGGAGVTTVKGSKSNTSDRMGGGGGTKAGGGVQLNPQPEPPGSKAK